MVRGDEQEQAGGGIVRDGIVRVRKQASLWTCRGAARARFGRFEHKDKVKALAGSNSTLRS